MIVTGWRGRRGNYLLALRLSSHVASSPCAQGSQGMSEGSDWERLSTDTLPMNGPLPGQWVGSSYPPPVQPLRLQPMPFDTGPSHAQLIEALSVKTGFAKKDDDTCMRAFGHVAPDLPKGLAAQCRCLRLRLSDCDCDSATPTRNYVLPKVA